MFTSFHSPPGSSLPAMIAFSPSRSRPGWEVAGTNLFLLRVAHWGAMEFVIGLTKFCAIGKKMKIEDECTFTFIFLAWKGGRGHHIR